jgi:DNA-binding beta-propeller fold protein YncE
LHHASKIFAHTIFTVMLTMAITPANAQKDTPLKLEQTFKLPPTIKGHFDHLAVDLDKHRLFLTPEDFHAVLVVDLNSGKLLRQIDGVDKPHAVLFRSDSDELYVTDGGDGSLKIFDGTTYKLKTRIPLLKDADSISFDPSRNQLFIVNGGGDIGQKSSMLTEVDTHTKTKLAEMAIGGDTIEAMSLDVNRPTIYINNREKNQIEVIDRVQRKIIASWPLTLGKMNVAMALDEDHQRLFIGCRSGQILVLDSGTGKELQALAIPKGVDDVTYDEIGKRLYAATDGAVSVYREVDADHYELLGNVPTGPLARTGYLVPALNRYFVAVPQHGTTDAAVLAFASSEPLSAPAATPPPAYHVDAPMAQHIVMETLSTHPFLRKLGLHAIAPGQTQSVIIANGNLSKIGKLTSPNDFKAVQDGKTNCKREEDGAYYDMKMQMFDTAGSRIGLTVMEIPFTAAADEADAIRQAEAIRHEMSAKISDIGTLFQN